MKISKNVDFVNFKQKIKKKISKKNLLNLIKSNNYIINSLKPSYKYSYPKNLILKYKKFKVINLIGMGGSILGTKAIFNFLRKKIKKDLIFIDNLNCKQVKEIKNSLNIIISKSGNTLETISNVNINLKKNKNNIFITENKECYLRLLAAKLKSEIIDHNNFIGGRYSVLSEVGMLPASLIGLNDKKFKQFNNLIKNKNFIDSLIYNVNGIFHYFKQKKYNSIILNYVENSDDLFRWYQQLVAESLGKNQKGILPIISSMPKDNHSVMQLYLDGPKNYFFTFFDVSENKSMKINNSQILKGFNFLKNKNIYKIRTAQKIATERVFLKEKIPFRSFNILRRSEEALGELFCFFILETILLSKMMKVNPYDQPSVELIKKETFKILN